MFNQLSQDEGTPCEERGLPDREVALTAEASKKRRSAGADASDASGAPCLLERPKAWSREKRRASFPKNRLPFVPGRKEKRCAVPLLFPQREKQERPVRGVRENLPPQFLPGVGRREFFDTPITSRSVRTRSVRNFRNGSRQLLDTPPFGWHVIAKRMTRATTCNLDGRLIDVQEALQLRDKAGNSNDLDFRCIECGERVKPHHEGVDGSAAHIEHLSNNPNCSLSVR